MGAMLNSFCPMANLSIAPFRRSAVLQGIVQHSTINNLAFGRSVEETLRTLQVCPCPNIKYPSYYWGFIF